MKIKFSRLTSLIANTRIAIPVLAVVLMAIGCGQTPQKPVEFANQNLPGTTGSYDTFTSAGGTAYDPSAGQVGATISGAPDTSYNPNTYSDPYNQYNTGTNSLGGESLSSLPEITQTGGPAETLGAFKDIAGIFGGNQSTNTGGGLFNQAGNQSGGLFNQGNNNGGLFSNFKNFFNRGNTVSSDGGLFNGGGLFSRIRSGGGLFRGLFR